MKSSIIGIILSITIIFQPVYAGQPPSFGSAGNAPTEEMTAVVLVTALVVTVIAYFNWQRLGRGEAQIPAQPFGLLPAPATFALPLLMTTPTEQRPATDSFRALLRQIGRLNSRDFVPSDWSRIGPTRLESVRSLGELTELMIRINLTEEFTDLGTLLSLPRNNSYFTRAQFDMINRVLNQIQNSYGEEFAEFARQRDAESARRMEDERIANMKKQLAGFEIKLRELQREKGDIERQIPTHENKLMAIEIEAEIEKIRDKIRELRERLGKIEK